MEEKEQHNDNLDKIISEIFDRVYLAFYGMTLADLKKSTGFGTFVEVRPEPTPDNEPLTKEALERIISKYFHPNKRRDELPFIWNLLESDWNPQQISTWELIEKEFLNNKGERYNEYCNFRIRYPKQAPLPFQGIDLY